MPKERKRLNKPKLKAAPRLTKQFEILDHTADIGVIVYGENLGALFENAGEAFFHLITDLRKVKRRIEKRIDIRGESLDRLMVDWLNELLYLHDVEGLLFKGFRVESVGKNGLKATAKGEPFQEGVHVIKTEVKAVTYHQIEVRQEKRRWRAQVIFDL
ncbi:MAG TPA: archease [Thermodesulfobacteriota bacterium]|nr:archease [Thermodesulfobacteriota bacterium]